MDTDEDMQEIIPFSTWFFRITDETVQLLLSKK